MLVSFPGRYGMLPLAARPMRNYPATDTTKLWHPVRSHYLKRSGVDFRSRAPRPDCEPDRGNRKKGPAKSVLRPGRFFILEKPRHKSTPKELIVLLLILSGPGQLLAFRY